MANHIVSYTLQLVNKFSAPLQKMAKDAAQMADRAKRLQGTIGRLPGSINDLQNRLSRLQNLRAFSRSEEDIRRFNGQIIRAQRELQRLENLPPRGFLNRLREMPKMMMGVSFKDIASVYGVKMAAGFIKQSMKLYDVEIKSQAQLRAALESTAYTAGRTFKQLTEQASELQKKTLFGNEVTQQAQAVLLTFTNVRGKIFDKAIPAAMDMATRKGMDLQSAIMSVGRALNSPADGLALLSRNGVQFSDEMEAQIKKLAEAGKLEEAQLLILDELFKKVGGSAEAAAKSGLGPWQQLSNMWGDLRERLGGFVLNIVNNVLPALKGLLEWLDRNGAAIKTMLKLVATGVIGYYSYKLAVSLCTVSLKSFAAGSLFARMASIALHHGVRGLARAFLFLNAVTKVSIIGALISAVTVAISLFAMFRKRVDDGTAAMKRAKETAEGYYAQEKSGLDMLFDKLKKTNPKSEDRNRLVDELKRMYPELNSQMEQELRTTNNLSTAYEALTASIVKKARIKGMEAAIEDAVGKTSGFDMAIEGLVAKAPVAEREGLRTKYWDEIKRLVAADGRYSVGQSAKFSEQWQKDLMAATVFSIDSELGMSAILSPKGAKAIASARRGYFFCISKKRCIFAA